MSLINNFVPETKREHHSLKYLDALKILSAFLVVFYHFGYYRMSYGRLDTAIYIPNMARIIMCAASCAVPLFFMINGALMFKRYRTVKNVYGKALKIVLLTGIWSFTGFASWFFITLCCLYICFPVFQWLRDRHKQIYWFICAVVFCFPFLYNQIILLLKWSGVLHLGPISVADLSVTGAKTMYSILYFLLGPELLRREGKATWKSIVLIVVGWGMVVLECTVYTNLSKVYYDGVNHAFPTIGALLMSVGVWGLSRKFSYRKLTAMLQFYGNAILPIYIFHSSIIKIYDIMLGNTQISLLMALVVTLCIVTVCAVLGNIMNRIPFLCWFVRI